MKNLIITFLTTVQIFSSAFKIDPPLTIDVVKSKANWTGYAEAGNYSPTGSINIKSGTLTMSNGNLKSTTIMIDMTSLTHDNKDLEKHLKDSDFFDCEKYPVAKFVLSKASKNTATGLLTIKNITKPIRFPIEMVENSGVFTIKANLKIDRTLYNIKYNSSSFFQDLGSYAIKNDFDLSILIITKK